MKPRATVLLVVNNFPPVRGGSAVVYDNLARYSNQRVIVLAPRLNYIDGLPLVGWREHDRQVPYRVVRLPLLRTVMERTTLRSRMGKLCLLLSDMLLRLRLLACLLYLVWREGVQTICIGELLASAWIVDLCRFLPFARTFVYVHGEEITTDDPYDMGHRRRRRTLQRADGIIVVSRFTLGVVRNLVGPDCSQKISLIENGVDIRRFRPGVKRPDLLDLYQLNGCFVFVSVCRLLEKKGIDHAIRAFASLTEKYPDCRYLVVGAGPYHATLERVASELWVTDKVLFVNQIPEQELVDHYRLGDVFVMPNRMLPNGDTEGFGLVFLEANSCGLPVIAGRDGGSIDAVRDGVNGLLVDGHSVSAIAAAMRMLRTDRALRDRLREEGLKLVVAADWCRKAEEFLRICVDRTDGQVIRPRA